MAAAIIANAAAIGGSIGLDAALTPKSKAGDNSCSVTISTGSGESALGGHMPHLALFDVNGARISQYKPSRGENIGDNDSKQLQISNDQTVPKDSPAQPEYISIVIDSSDKDGICLAYVTVSGDDAQWAWVGDYGYACGADWYPSNHTVASSAVPPRCVWLDSQHGAGGDGNPDDVFHFQSLSLHMRDFTSDPGRSNQYTTDMDTLCKSDPRMKFWGTLTPDGHPPIFDPPLAYNTDGSDVDPARVKNPDGIEHHRKRQQAAPGSQNTRSTHVIISNIDAHSADELCDSGTSRGPSFVSLKEGTFCDMTAKQTWPLCSAATRESCFDVGALSMRGGTNADGRGSDGGSGSRKRDVQGQAPPNISFETSEHWGS